MKRLVACFVALSTVMDTAGIAKADTAPLSIFFRLQKSAIFGRGASTLDREAIAHHHY